MFPVVGYCCLVGMWLGAAFVWAVWSSVLRGDGCAVFFENFIINTALHVSGTLRPSSGAYGNCTCSLWCWHAVFSPHIV